MQSAIEINGLRKAYGDVEAVRDVSFSVGDGEVFCLLGPNGAGKTTTARSSRATARAARAMSASSATTPSGGERALRERSASCCRRRPRRPS